MDASAVLQPNYKPHISQKQSLQPGYIAPNLFLFSDQQRCACVVVIPRPIVFHADTSIELGVTESSLSY